MGQEPTDPEEYLKLLDAKSVTELLEMSRAALCRGDLVEALAVQHAIIKRMSCLYHAP